MTDFFTKKQGKYWCEVCRIFIEYNKKTIDYHNSTSNHINNMKRGSKYDTMKKKFNNYVNELYEKQNYSMQNNDNSFNETSFLGNKRKIIFENQMKQNTSMFNEVKSEMMKKEIKDEKIKDKWKVFYDKKTKHIFFFNYETGESQWEKPEVCNITDKEINKLIKINEENDAYDENEIDEKDKEGNVGEWVKIDRKEANKIFGKRKNESI